MNGIRQLGTGEIYVHVTRLNLDRLRPVEKINISEAASLIDSDSFYTSANDVGKGPLMPRLSYQEAVTRMIF